MAAQSWRWFLPLTILFFVLPLHSAFSADPPEYSFSPVPESGADTEYTVSSPPVNSPASTPDFSFPLASYPSVEDSGTPFPSPYLETSPAPSLSESMSMTMEDSDEDTSPDQVENYRSTESFSAFTGEEESSGGGKKARTVFGVTIGAAVVVFAGIIYKKRRENSPRSRGYGYAITRREPI